MKNRKGFAITELVIVIAVIAILAAVLIPTFSGVIKKANASKALQEARNLMVNYVAANDAKVPDIYYIQVEGGYFKVENGVLAEEPQADAPTSAGTVIVSKDTAADEDEWPDFVTVPTANPAG